MIRNFQKTCVGLVFALSAVSFSGQASAQDYGYSDYKYCDSDYYGTFGIHGEYLFWTVQTACQDYVRQLTYPEIEVNNEPRLGVLSNDDICSLSHKWRSGFRLGVDYKCSLDDPWRYAAYYTYYRSQDKAKRHLPEEPVAGEHTFFFAQIPFALAFVEIPQLDDIYFFNEISGNEIAHSVEFAKSRERLRLDFGDAEVTRINCLCGPATFNVLVGVRGGYIRNHWNTFYRYIDDEVETTPGLTWFQNVKAKIHNDWSFLSIGPRVGGQFDWNIGCGFSLYVDASLSALWGKVKNRISNTFEGDQYTAQSVEPLIDPFTVKLADLNRSRYKSVPLFQGEAGLAWFTTFENFVVDAKIGVELMHFVNLAENFHHPVAFPGKIGLIRSLDLYGLTVGFGVLF